MAEQIITLKTHFLQSCKDFFQANGLDPNRWTYNNHTGEEVLDAMRGALMFNADVNRPLDPDGYAAEIAFGDKTITIPAGRMVHIGHDAGYVRSISCTLPLDTISFDEMMSSCGDIARQFEQIGFKLVRKKDQMTEQEFHEKGGNYNQYGEWQIEDPLPISLTLEMNNFNRMLTTSFTMPLADPTPRDAPPSYLVSTYITLESKARFELVDLKYARNLAVNGDRNQPLPLKLWFDDPDWRPANWQGQWLK